MGTRRRSSSSNGEAERRLRPDVRDHALQFAVATVLGALPGTRRLDQWWCRQSWRRILLYRLLTAAAATALVQWGESYSRRVTVGQDNAD
jgi:hypothetical protein